VVTDAGEGVDVEVAVVSALVVPVDLEASGKLNCFVVDDSGDGA
jgi:hypothetical protein